MRRRCELLAAVVTVLLAAACGGTKLLINLQPGCLTRDSGGRCTAPEDTSKITHVLIVLRDKAGHVDKSVIDVKAAKENKEQAAVDQVTVQDDAPFTIEAWGCPGAADCDEDHADFKGCKAVDLRDENTDESVPVVVEVFAKDADQVAGCPIDPKALPN